MTKIYITNAGDMWDFISYKLFGSERYTDILISANIEHKDTSMFGSGVVLIIPVITTPKPSTLPPWKR